eukprot:2144722-Prymnesium_polylepis.1
MDPRREPQQRDGDEGSEKRTERVTSATGRTGAVRYGVRTWRAHCSTEPSRSAGARPSREGTSVASPPWRPRCHARSLPPC